MKRFATIVACFLLGVATTVAQDSTLHAQPESDTVVVTAQRALDFGARQTHRVREMEDVFSRDFRSVRQLPSVHISQTGSQQTSFSVRNSPAHHSSVVILGLPLNSSLRGASNLAVIPLADVASVTRVTGLSTGSARSISGSLQLDVQPLDNHFAAEMGAGIGSFGTKTLAARGGMPVDSSIGVGASYSWHQSEGNFGFVDSRGNDVERIGNNSESHQIGFLMQGKAVDWYSAVTDSRGGSPRSAVSQFGVVEQASLNQFVALTVARWHGEVGGGLLVGSVGAYREEQRFHDPAAAFGGGDGYEEEYRELRISGNVEYFVSLSNQSLLSAIVYGAREAAESVGGSISGQPVRFVSTAELQYSHVFEDGVLSGGSVTAELGVMTNSLFRPLPVGGIGYDMKLSRSVSIGAVWRIAARWPSLNELYFLNFGNTELKPEISHQWELVGEYLAGDVAVSTTFYSAWLTDMISAAPSGAASITALNFHSVHRYGLEAEFAYCVDEFSLEATATISDSEIATPGSINKGNSTPYSPKFAAVVAASYHLPWAVLGTDVSYTGERFALAGNTAGSALSAYSVVDVRIKRAFEVSETTKAHVLVSLRNSFDVQYEHILGYPMPGRSVTLGVQLDLH